MPPSDVPPDRAIQAVALFEASKGIVVLLVATGLVSLLHRDVGALATTLVEHTHLNPASRYPRIFLDAAQHVQDSRLLLLAAGAAVYAIVRLVEAYGLFHQRRWAEVLAAGSGALYVPFELLGLSRRPSWHGAVLLSVNLVVVAVMVHALRSRHRAQGASVRR